MKKAIAILLALCFCVGLCACSSSEEKKSTPTTEPAQYEDTLIEVIKIGDSLIHAEEIFGTPVSSEDYPYDPYNMHYEYKDVTIYDLEFTPNIYAGSNSEVLNLSYIYYSNIHSATYEQAYEKLLNNFIRLYGEPDEKANKANIWHFENGTRLYVSNMAIFANTYRIAIELRQQTK